MTCKNIIGIQIFCFFISHHEIWANLVNFALIENKGYVLHFANRVDLSRSLDLHRELENVKVTNIKSRYRFIFHKGF